MRTVAKWTVGLLAVVGAGAVAGAIGFAAQGLPSRAQPLAIEVKLARTVGSALPAKVSANPAGEAATAPAADALATVTRFAAALKSDRRAMASSGARPWRRWGPRPWFSNGATAIG